MITRFLPAPAIALLVAGCSGGSAAGDAAGADALPPPLRSATAMLYAADGSPRGEVTVTDTDGAIKVAVAARGLPPGAHGMHIHAVGRCDAPDFATAGGHWNPTAQQHGRNNPAGKHRGDLPNLVAGADGSASLEAEVEGAGLTGSDGLLDADGAAFVIHATADDYVTDPSGNSGARIACGVFAAG